MHHEAYLLGTLRFAPNCRNAWHIMKNIMQRAEVESTERSWRNLIHIERSGFGFRASVSRTAHPAHPKECDCTVDCASVCG